jgi:hypothetical protein
MTGVGKINGIGMDGRSRLGRMSEARLPSSFGTGRSAVPRPRRAASAFAREKASKVLLLLVACVALVVVSAIVSTPSSSGDDPVAPPSYVPVNVSQKQPPPPYPVFGFVYDLSGVEVVGAFVNVTNTRTGEFLTNVTDEYGYYTVDLNLMPSRYQVGDLINVTADDGVMIGWNESIVPDPEGAYLWIDVTLGAVIPEFQMVMVPVVGMLALVAVIARTRRRGQ